MLKIRRSDLLVAVLFMLVVSLACNAPGGSDEDLPRISPDPTQDPVQTSGTPVPPDHQPFPTLTTAPSLGIGSEAVAPVDGAVLVYVPAGEFIMGSDPDTDPYFWGAEAPQHKVYLDAYWIYQSEVTNAMYAACVGSGGCSEPQNFASVTRSAYYGESHFDSYPVIQVQWVQAQEFCTWAGGELPTEARWEKAARGSQDARLFPWGDQYPDGEHANFCDHNCLNTDEGDPDINDGYADTAPVGSFPNGVSLYGALDMSGNVWEWIADWHEAEYFGSSPYENPAGPKTGTRKGIRGGSWFNGVDGIRVTTRASQKPDNHFDSVGFRCVFNASE